MINYTYKFNELAYATDILDKGFITKYYQTEMGVLVKYWKYLGLKPSDRKDNLISFLSKNITDFSVERYYKEINKALNFGKKKTSVLVVVESIPITKLEFDFICNIPMEEDYKRILFAYLFRNKMNKVICQQIFREASEFNYYGGSAKQYNEIKDMAGLKRSVNIYHMEYDLEQLGYIRTANKGKIELKFVGMIEKDTEILFEIDDYNSIFAYYDIYTGCKKYRRCEVCGEIIKKETPNSKIKYCEKCAKEAHKEVKRNWKISRSICK